MKKGGLDMPLTGLEKLSDFIDSNILTDKQVKELKEVYEQVDHDYTMLEIRLDEQAVALENA